MNLPTKIIGTLWIIAVNFVFETNFVLKAVYTKQKEIVNVREEKSWGVLMHLIINKETYNFFTVKYKQINFESIF